MGDHASDLEQARLFLSALSFSTAQRVHVHLYPHLCKPLPIFGVLGKTSQSERAQQSKKLS